MYEVMYYVGLVLSISFFLLSVFLFFYHKVPSVVRYFIKMGNKRVVNPDKARNSSDNQTDSDNSTELLDDESTSLLDVAKNYATALLDADSTTLLPELVAEED